MGDEFFAVPLPVVPHGSETDAPSCGTLSTTISIAPPGRRFRRDAEGIRQRIRRRAYRMSYRMYHHMSYRLSYRMTRCRRLPPPDNRRHSRLSCAFGCRRSSVLCPHRARYRERALSRRAAFVARTAPGRLSSSCVAPTRQSLASASMLSLPGSADIPRRAQ